MAAGCARHGGKPGAGAPGRRLRAGTDDAADGAGPDCRAGAEGPAGYRGHQPQEAAPAGPGKGGRRRAQDAGRIRPGDGRPPGYDGDGRRAYLLPEHDGAAGCGGADPGSAVGAAGKRDHAGGNRGLCREGGSRRHAGEAPGPEPDPGRIRIAGRGAFRRRKQSAAWGGQTSCGKRTSSPGASIPSVRICGSCCARFARWRKTRTFS